MDVLISLTQMSCPCCGGTYALNKTYVDEARSIGGFKQMWGCPYCKTELGFGESTEAKLQKKLAAKDRRIKQLGVSRQAARDRESQTERRLIATRGHLTRMKNEKEQNKNDTIDS